MKTKLLKLTAILLIVAGAFTSCDEKEQPTPFLNIDKTNIIVSAKGGIFHIDVNSNGKWTAVIQDAENNLWCTLTNDLGINDGVVTVNVFENPDFTARIAPIKISMGSLSKYVVINQDGKYFPLEHDCKNELFFYYNSQGGKQFFYDLLLNDWLLVAFYPEIQDEKIMEFVNQLGIVRNTTSIIRKQVNPHNFLYIQTMVRKKCSQLKEIIYTLEQYPIVAYANLAFYFVACFGFSCSDIGSFSNFFYVQVRNSNNLSDLHAVMQRTNTWIYTQDTFMPNWFVLGTDGNSKGNALQMSRYFFETGKFLNAYPDMIYWSRNH